MKKLYAVLGAVLLTGMLLTGCNSELDIAKINTSTLNITKTGGVDAIFVEDFSQDYYDQAGLDKMVNEEVDDFIAVNGEGSVKLNTVNVENNMAKVSLAFDGYESYAAFEGEYLFTGTVKAALDSGYSFTEDLKIAGDEGETISATKILEYGDCNVVITSEPVNVIVPGKIMYLSVDAKLLSENTVDTYENQGETVVIYK